MRKMKIWTKVVLLVAIVLVAVLAVWRYIEVNRKFPSPPIERYQLGETVSFNGVEVVASDFEMLTIDEMKAAYPDLDDYVGIKDTQQMNMLVKVKMKNVSADPKDIEPPDDYSMQSVAWGNGADMEIYGVINDGKELKKRRNLAPGEEVTLTLGYSAVDAQFTKQKWSEIRSRKFQLVLTTYPIKKVIAMNE